MDTLYMEKAIQMAKQAFESNEVPVGSIIVENESVLSYGYNKIEKTNSSLEHSEIIAIRNAQKKKNNWRLNDCTIYTTLEPCLMCTGAIINARIKKVVYATKSNYLSDEERTLINKMYQKNNIELVHGVLKVESQKLLTDFFERKRKNK